MRIKSRIPVSIIMLLLIVAQGVSKASKPSELNPNEGSICIAAVPKPTSGNTSLANPTGGGRTFNYKIQIDKGLITPVSTEKPILISGLVLKRKHLIKIRRDGKLVESFSFTFEKERSNRLCLWFKPLYETWTLWAAKDAGRKCDCE